MGQSPQLSNREWEVAELALQGKSNKIIASTLNISERTVEFHLRNIYDKCQVSSRVELILKLGKTTDGLETEKPGYSTVDNKGENTENEAGSSSEMNWVTSLRETISLIGKELSMQKVLKSDAYDEATPMTFQKSIRVCLSKYADFDGRATRAEFWWFTLFVVLVAGALGYMSEALSSIFLITMLLPLLAAGTRRLHDIGKSGWWWLFALVPVGGIVVLAVLWSQPGMVQPDADKVIL